MELMQYQASDTDGEILSFLSWSFLSLNRKSKSIKRWQGGNQSVRDAAFMVLYFEDEILPTEISKSGESFGRIELLSHFI